MRSYLNFLFIYFSWFLKRNTIFILVAKALSLHSENEMDFSVLAAKYVTHSAGLRIELQRKNTMYVI